MSCAKCVNIMFKSWNQLGLECITRLGFNPNTYDNHRAVIYVHHENMSNLQSSSQQCHFCRKLYVGLQHQLRRKGKRAGQNPIYLKIIPPSQYRLASDASEGSLNVWVICGIFQLSTTMWSFDKGTHEFFPSNRIFS
jgi:hypothetical protein